METGKQNEKNIFSLPYCIDIYHPLPLLNSKNVCVPVFSHNHYHCDCSAGLGLSWKLLH